MEVLDLQPEIQDKPNAKSIKRAQGAIEFENITTKSNERRKLKPSG